MAIQKLVAKLAAKYRLSTAGLRADPSNTEFKLYSSQHKIHSFRSGDRGRPCRHAGCSRQVGFQVTTLGLVARAKVRDDMDDATWHCIRDQEERERKIR